VKVTILTGNIYFPTIMNQSHNIEQKIKPNLPAFKKIFAGKNEFWVSLAFDCFKLF
jgi:hypothetical protein